MASLPREKTGLHARMERIEKQNRQLKRYVAVLAVSFFSVAMLGAAAALTDGQFRQITAEKIILVDDAGRERIRLGSGSEGTGLQILNSAGKKILGMGLPADENGNGILFSDGEGRPRIGLGLEEGLPSMVIVDEKGKKIIGMGGDERGYGLSIMDGNEVERAGIGFKEGNSGVVLYDETGQYVRGMIRQKDGLHYFSYMDDSGQEMVLQ